MTVTVPAFPPLLGYVPREYLAQGGQSIVYRALNHATNHLAALKVVPLDPAAASSRKPQTDQAESAELSPAMQQKAKQLVREMRIHETLDHRNILRLFGGETRQACVVETEKGTTTAWPTGLYMVLDLGQSRPHFSPSHTQLTHTFLFTPKRSFGHRCLDLTFCMVSVADGGDLFDKISESTFTFP